MVRTAPPPAADIRLMNATAALIAALAVAVFVATGLRWAARQPAFAVRSIRIVGDLAHNSVVTIRANAMPRLSGNFFTMDLAQGRRAFESVPWVRQALVRRVWPNRLVVQLEEHRPVALWAASAGSDDATDQLVDSFGEVFEANLGDVEDQALPTLRGPAGTSAHLLSMLGRLQSAFAPLQARLETLELSGRGSWRVVLDTGSAIELGRGSDAEVVERTERFVATVPAVTKRYERPLEYADLRHNEGYAVRLKGISTTVDASVKPTKKK